MGRGWFLNFFMGFNDFKTQKVYLLRLMPVYVGLTMVGCLCLSVPLIISGLLLNRAEFKAACRLHLIFLNPRNIGIIPERRGLISTKNQRCLQKIQKPAAALTGLQIPSPTQKIPYSSVIHVSI